MLPLFEAVRPEDPRPRTAIEHARAWVRGEAGSPYLTVKYQPFALQIGSVTRDFSITAAASESLAPTLGSSATWSFTLKRVGSGSFGSNVALSVEAMPESTLPTGLGAADADTALALLLERLPRLRLDPARPPEIRGLVFRKPPELRVLWSKRVSPSGRTPAREPGPLGQRSP